MARRRRRRCRGRTAEPLKTTIGALTGWEAPATPPQCHAPARLPVPPPNARSVLAALAALPKLAASIGLAVAAHPDGRVEVLPGEPTTVLFTARGQLRGLFLLPTSETEARRLLGLQDEPVSNAQAGLLWELDRRHVSDIHDPS
jgi:hypothetical protein